ncbi:MAG: hypothetical protein ACHQ1H_07300, partial [Nitrososphaerales archaeon]
GEESTTWLEPYGFRFEKDSPFVPAYLVPQEGLTDDIPSYEYALYEGASQWSVERPARALALLGEPLFQRNPDHYTSHAQSPYDHTTKYAAIAQSGRLALFAFPLGRSYYNQGYWVYRQMFQKVLKELLPTPLIQTDSPMSAEVTLTHQDVRTDPPQKERYMVHIVNYSPLRQSPRHSVFCEDPIPLSNVAVRLNLPLKVAAARAVIQGTDLEVHRTPAGGVEVLVPRVPIYEVLSFEVS